MADGLSRPPVLLGELKLLPPQTIISLPVHTAVWPLRPDGALEILVAVQLSSPGIYRPPELIEELPPHMSITRAAHTAV